MMNVQQWLNRAQAQLESAGIGTSRLDSLVLLEDATTHDRAWLLANPEFELDEAVQLKLEKLLNSRADHEPLAYLRGKTEFYGREFVLTPDVLEPRPESETMIDMLKVVVTEEALGDSQVRIADVGTGSGALGITAKLELPNADVALLDIDEAALKVAKTNVDLFTLIISVIKSDLLADTSGHYDILLCNLPYVPDGYEINPAAMREPAIAIFGGPDGLDLYRRLFEQVSNRADGPLYILTEALPAQHDQLQSIAESSGYRLCRADDFIQAFRRP